jgi:hypothetical protein
MPPRGKALREGRMLSDILPFFLLGALREGRMLSDILPFFRFAKVRFQKDG